MKKMLKLTTVLLLMVGLFSCEKESSFVEPEEDSFVESEDESPKVPLTFVMNEVDDLVFCSSLNSKSIDRTIPIIKNFLSGLPNNLDDEKKLHALAAWFKSSSRIIDTTVAYKSNFAPNGIWESEVVISYDESGTIKYFRLEILMTKPLVITGFYGPDKPRDLFVKTKYDYPMDKVLDFVNSLNLDIVDIRYTGSYFSSLSNDHLESIVNSLNNKPYFNANDYGYNWRTIYGAVHFYYNKITIVRPTFYNMKNKDYQKDWLNTMITYKLAEAIEDEDPYKENSGYWILFRVPKGTEKQWETKFKQYEFVEEVNLVSYPYPVVINPWP
ncbi:MAG: hypothetical protein FWD56_00895 [Bacteroidales bacterium]|nr:hypothetical protein [Bacteroidales bacterium]